MKTLLFALCAHLGLPADPFFLWAEDWPDANALRSFVLYVSDAPVKLIDGELVTKPILPRWEAKSRFGRIRKMPALESDPSQKKPGSAFLSLDETQEALCGFEESFRNALWNSLHASFSESVLATYKGPMLSGPGTRPRAGTLNYRSALKRAIALGLTKNECESSDCELCNWLDEEEAADLPAAWTKNNDRSFLSAYRDPERRHRVESIINKVRRDMRRKALL